jgi:uncharacterized protein (DUF305 family)
MKRTVLASVTALVLVLGLVAVGMALRGDRDGWMWDGHRDGDGGSMMSGGRGMGLMGHSAVRSEAEYLVEMVAHHEDAIVAAAELSRSDRPRMRALGESIVESQSAQVEQMNAWLAAWHPDAPEADYQPMMSDLSGLSGDRLDRVFLRDMVGHHMMAVMMSQQLLVRGTADHQEVAQLARTIRDDQRAEIRLMVRWSRAWFGTFPMMGQMMSPWGR